MNEGEFKRFLVEAHSYCMPRLTRLNAPEHEAEDAFMEAIYQFWSDISAGKVKHDSNLKALVFVMSRNRWLGQLRKSKRGNLQEYSTNPMEMLNLDQQSYVSKDVSQFDLMVKKEEEEERDLEKSRKNKAFQEAFQQLSGKCQQLLLQFIVEKQRLKDLQQSLGFISVDAIKMAKLRCKKSLVKYYKQITATS